MRYHTINTILFDFDGVVADTEPQYDSFWDKKAVEYGIDIPDFAHVIKGTTLQNIFNKYFSHVPVQEHEKIAKESAEFELEMDFPEIPGAIGLIKTLRQEGYKLGLVTSSSSVKMEKALPCLGLENTFDVLVTADHITKGKPDPMCYLLAAEKLDSRPGECIVFEDSFSGIQAGRDADMCVIGLATTNPENTLKDKVYAVISDFTDIRKVLSLVAGEN